MANHRLATWLSAALGGAALLCAGCAADIEETDGGDAPIQQEGPSGTAAWGGAGPGGDYGAPAIDDGFPDELGDAVDNNPGVDDPVGDPEPDDPILPGPLGDATLVILASEAMGRSLLVVDEVGGLIETIPLTNPNVMHIAWHPDGFFVGSDGGNLVQIDLQGNVSTIAPVYGFLYRVNVSGDGSVDTAEEDEVASYDMQGNRFDSLGAPGACYMDMGVDTNGAPLALDVWNYKVVEWTGAGFVDVVTNLPSGISIFGRDESDTVWIADGWGAELLVQNGMSAVSLGELSALGQPASSIQAIEPADEASVYVLSSDYAAGSALSIVSQDGDLVSLASSTTGSWLDLVRID